MQTNRFGQFEVKKQFEIFCMLDMKQFSFGHEFTVFGQLYVDLSLPLQACDVIIVY